MEISTVLHVCLTEAYPTALEKCGISYSLYLAIRRERRIPTHSNLARRNMKFRQDVLKVVREHPHYAYREVAAALNVSMSRVWKVFTDYMLHDETVRMRIARCNVALM